MYESQKSTTTCCGVGKRRRRAVAPLVERGPERDRTGVSEAGPESPMANYCMALRELLVVWYLGLKLATVVPWSIAAIVICADAWPAFMSDSIRQGSVGAGRTAWSAQDVASAKPVMTEIDFK